MQQPPPEQPNQQPYRQHIMPPPYGYSPPPPQPPPTKKVNPWPYLIGAILGAILISSVISYISHKTFLACNEGQSTTQFILNCGEKLAVDVSQYDDHFGRTEYDDRIVGTLILREYVKAGITADQIKQECFTIHQAFGFSGLKGTRLPDFSLVMIYFYKVDSKASDSSIAYCEMETSDARRINWGLYDYLKAWNEKDFYAEQFIDAAIP